MDRQGGAHGNEKESCKKEDHEKENSKEEVILYPGSSIRFRGFCLR